MDSLQLTVDVKTTPQMTRFRNVKVCNTLATDEIDEVWLQHELQHPEGNKSTLGIAYAWWRLTTPMTTWPPRPRAPSTQSTWTLPLMVITWSAYLFDLESSIPSNFLFFSFIFNLLHFLLHFFHNFEDSSNTAYFAKKRRWILLTNHTFTHFKSPRTTTSWRLTSSPSQSPWPTHSSPSNGSSRMWITMTPRSRRCFITHTEYTSITPSEKACIYLLTESETHVGSCAVSNEECRHTPDCKRSPLPVRRLGRDDRHSGLGYPTSDSDSGFETCESGSFDGRMDREDSDWEELADVGADLEAMFGSELEERQRIRAKKLVAIHGTIELRSDDDSVELFEETLPPPTLSSVDVKGLFDQRDELSRDWSESVRIEHYGLSRTTEVSFVVACSPCAKARG